jgi:hypothetical protein
LEFPGTNGPVVRILPLTLVIVVKETPGVQSFQIIQTARTRLEVRLLATASEDDSHVWSDVQARLQAFLASQGVSPVEIKRSDEVPARSTRSGKMRQVWSELHTETIGDYAGSRFC